MDSVVALGAGLLPTNAPTRLAPSPGRSQPRLQVDSHYLSLLERSYPLRRGPLPESAATPGFATGRGLAPTFNPGGARLNTKRLDINPQMSSGFEVSTLARSLSVGSTPNFTAMSRSPPLRNTFKFTVESIAIMEMLMRN